MRTNEFNEHLTVAAAEPLPLRMMALNIAMSYEGQKEVPAGSNAGAFVEACLRLVGLPKGNAWCMAFVYRCMHEAAIRLGIANPCQKTAGVLRCLNETPKDRVILKKDANTSNILPGYQFILDYGKGLGHTGLVVAVHADGSFTTIEGNTDANGSRTGGMVCKRVRRFDDKLLRAFIKY